ncbi:hypothetical protein GO730_00755 [Spirosoma sp. HMF3257]|uniref:Uncharacterized protein n=1 Tax=Spirosoma telluris TaxID=2183553 RepID=A0A327NGC7_9BACT|nr:hypothetical protein [Spirosoma telluris]RAI73329.1 hypothetical protein HMF3257_00735 [Spirosoma telluris]
MRVKVQAQLLFNSIVRFGAADIDFILQKNGQEVTKTAYSKGGYYDGLDIPDTIQIDTSVDCLAGDELTLRLTGSSRTTFSDYAYYFSLASGDTWASFTPDSLVHLGDIWPVAQNLPADITCSDLALTIAKVMQGTYVVDSLHNTVKLVPLDDVIDNIPNAKDWSKNTDESVQPELTVQFDGYSAKNWYKWREYEDKTSIGYGDGFITCGNTANSKESTLFELPFMACIDSSTTVGGYGNPIYIKTRSISKSGDTITVNKNDAAARLILVEPTKTVVVQTNTLTPSGDIVKVGVTLTACWWAKRPMGARVDDNAFSLAFTGVSGQVEESLITRHFTATKRILRRPRMLNASVYLHPSDIATLDLSVPIRLKGVRLGSLDINDNLFYLNSLGPYRSGMVCNATLIVL